MLNNIKQKYKKVVINITFIRGFSEPYEILYYQELDKNEKLNEQIFYLEEERDIALKEVEDWKTLYLKKPLYERVNDKESIICAMSKLQYLLDELEDMT